MAKVVNVTCTRRIQFCSGHRVYKHKSKCAHLHGHNYVVFIHARVEQLDALGRVIDFSILKDLVGGWIDEHWDHGFLLDASDKEGRAALAMMGLQQKVYFMENPTAENMALHLLNICKESLMFDTGVEVFKIVLWETENCFAEAILDQ